MRRRRGGAAGLNFWPGYVDAMMNVVLNLIFLVAVFAFALFMMSLGSAKGISFAGKGASEAKGKGDATSTTASAAVRQGDAVVANAGATAADSGGSRQQGARGDGDGSGGQGLGAGATGAFSGPGARARNQPPLVDIAVARQGADAARQGQAEAAAARVVQVRQEPDSALLRVDFPSTTSQSLQGASGAAVSAALRQSLSKEAQVTVWAPVALGDPAHRRAAYLRVMTVRDLLVRDGVAASRVEVRLLGGESQSGAGREVYVMWRLPQVKDDKG